MSIVFFCQSCGKRFEVEAHLAGKTGRCRSCGQLMVIPRAEELASMVALPVVAPAPAGAGARAAAAPEAAVASSLSSWLKAAVSNVGLAPLTVERTPALARKKAPAPATPLDDAEDSKPYALAFPEQYGSRGTATRAAGAAFQAWRREVGVVQRLFRWLNESAYLVSVPFLMILLLGVVLKSRNLALFGATFVVLLNIGRIVAGVANLALVPLRDGLNRRKMKKPLGRVVEPVLTIGMVVLAFTFIPWLSAGRPAQGSVARRLRNSAEDLGQDIQGELKQTVDRARSVDVEKLGEEARERLRTIGTGPDGANGAAPQNGQSPEAAIGGLIKDVGKRVRETVDESQKQPPP